ncbi:hypothetical protein BCON_0028g00590 [Botryotinia convoluta]|uniref:Uncharacterized protein n=1 Tax=Botryotinia convoluta TaxID=54673 RepID=A0A4Z1IIW5_9HELO|nr:hypothetical protein BCON_0028g00590 [Botryotinia convoluta]
MILMIAPPVPGTLWKEIDYPQERSGGGADEKTSKKLLIYGHFIAKGTIIDVDPYAIIHDEEYFLDLFV